MPASRPSRRSPVRLALALALPVALTGALAAGCSATNAIQTDRTVATAEGVSVDLGDVRVVNLLAVATAAGEPGALSGAVTNDGAGPAHVTLTAGADAATLDVPAGGTVYFGTGGSTGERVPLAAVDAAPGALLDVTLDADTAGGASVRIPVMDGTVPPFDAVLAG